MKIATAAIIKQNEKFLIAKRKEGGVVGGKWEFPGGKKKIGESLQECLKRELMEELGIEVEVGNIFDEHVHSYKAGKIKLFAYEIKSFEGLPQLKEHKEIRWVSASQMPNFRFVGNDRPIIKKLACYDCSSY